MGLSDITLFRAKDIMTTSVVTVAPDTTIERVADLFELHRVSGLPVVDLQGRLLGMITEYDLLQSIDTLQMRGTAADFMTSDVIAVGPEATLIELARVFLAAGVRRVPVTRGGKLVGIVSRRDLVFAGKIRQQLLCELPTLAVAAEEH